MKIELKCKSCEKNFITDFKHRDKQFCNRSCYFIYANKHKLLGKERDESVRENRRCVQCNNEFTERIKHKRILCSQECRLLWNQITENKEKRLLKSKNVLQDKYGTNTFFGTADFKKNYKNIFNLKYGVDHPMGVPEFVEKLQNTHRDKHLSTLIPILKENNLQLLGEYIANKNGSTSKPYEFKCDKCDNTFTSTLLGSGKIPICRKCFPIIKNSKLEEIIRDFINSNNIKHIDNNRTLLNGKEIDILLPEYNIGIEINGNYFHSEISGDKDKKYHIDKSIISGQKNIKLLQIFEDEVLLKIDIVFSRLSSFFNLNKKIFARNCVLKEVSKKESKLFLIKNHIQGESIDKFRYGLYEKDVLVSIITFGKKRKVLGNTLSTNNEYELIRFCNKLNTTVVGGFSKLLKFFIKTHLPSKIETYADIRWSGINPENTVYNKNGFKFLHITPPNYWYVDKKNYLHRYHRYNFRKDILIKEGFSKNKTEWEIMQERNYDRIWDCGSMKFELNI
jgi:hypothetical protein